MLSWRLRIPWHHVKSRPQGKPSRDLCVIDGPSDLLLVGPDDQAKQIAQTMGGEKSKLGRTRLNANCSSSRRKRCDRVRARNIRPDRVAEIALVPKMHPRLALAVD